MASGSRAFNGGRRAPILSLRGRIGVVVAEVGADDEEGADSQQRTEQISDPFRLSDAHRDRQDRNVVAEHDLEEWQLDLESVLGRVRRIVHPRAQGAGVAGEIAIDVDGAQGGKPAVGRGNRGAVQGHEVGRTDQHEPVDRGSTGPQQRIARRGDRPR